MNDYEYVFKQDSKEKKNIGNSARKMNRTGKGPIKFPSDYLTASQKKKLNGPCATYDMGKPMSWQDFSKMPEDLQRLYLQGIMDKFHPSQRALAELFGTHKGMIAGKLKEFGIAPSGQPRSGKNKNFNEAAWDAWIADGIIPEDTANSHDDVEVVDAYISKFKPMPVKEDTLEETVPLVKIPDNVISKVEPYVSPVETDVELQKAAVSSVKNNIPKETYKMYSKVLDDALKNKYRGQETDFSVLMDLWNSYLVNSGDWLLNHRLTLGDIKVLLLLQNIERVMAEPYNDMYWDSVLEFVSFVKNNPEAF